MTKGLSPIPTGQLSMADVAVKAGLPYQTIRRYRVRGVVPEPAGYAERNPYWAPDVIDAWVATRRTRRRH